VSVGVSAYARPQGTNDGASRRENEYGEADGIRVRDCTGMEKVKKKKEGDGVVATRKYCTKAIEDDEDEANEAEDEKEEEENGWEQRHKVSGMI
jgi:hypothetical protein